MMMSSNVTGIYISDMEKYAKRPPGDWKRLIEILKRRMTDAR